jgi:glycopeptide antibiotics resistance protein
MPSSAYIRCLEENYRADSYYSKYCIYFVIIVVALTMAPYNFQFEESHSFSWKYQSFDILTNLFLFSPIGFFLTLLKQDLSIKFFLGLLLLGILASFLIEGLQLYIPQRASQYWDVICNVVSLLLGAIGAALVLRLFANKKTRSGYHPSILLSPLILIGLLLAMRTINSEGIVDGFILSYIFISTGIIAITFSHVSKTRIKSLPYYVFFGCMTYLFLFTFPLLLQNPLTYLALLLAFPILIFFSTLFLAKKSTSFLEKFRKSLAVILLMLCIYYSGATLNVFSTVLVDCPISPWDKVKPFSQGTAMGVVLVEYILLASILIELTKYTLLIYGQIQFYRFLLLCILGFVITHWYLLTFSHPEPNNASFVYFLYAAIIIIVWENKLTTPKISKKKQQSNVESL